MQQVVLGIMLPLFLSMAPHPPPQPQPEQQQLAAQRHEPAWRQVAGAAQKAWCCANSALASVGDDCDSLQLLVVGWLLLGNVWMVVCALVGQQ